MATTSVLSAATLVTATTGIVECLLLPLQGRQLLVPATTVAASLRDVALQRPEHAASWYMGEAIWQEQPLPVLAYEALNEGSAPRDRHHIAIIQTLSAEAQGYYGLILQAEARSAKVKLNELEDLLEVQSELGPMDAMAVRWQGELAWIPNFDAIERRLLA